MSDPTNESMGDGIQHVAQISGDILGKKSQHEIPILLEKKILPSVSPISFAIGQMLGAVQLDRQACLHIEQIDFHFAMVIKLDLQHSV